MPEAATPSQEMFQHFGRIYTGAISDVLDDDYGLYDQWFPSDLKPVKPGIRAVGVAFPVTGYAARQTSPDSIRPILTMMGEVPPDAIVIYETNGAHTGALVGEFAVNTFKIRGARGAITDGGMRDTELVLAEDFPVWARYTTPANAVPRWQIDDWNCAVTIGQCHVRPGDVIVADRDGIVAIPRDIAPEILTKCEALIGVEDQLRDGIRSGLSPLEAYDKYA